MDMGAEEKEEDVRGLGVGMHSLPFASKRLPSEIVEVNSSRIVYKKY